MVTNERCQHVCLRYVNNKQNKKYASKNCFGYDRKHLQKKCFSFKTNYAFVFHANTHKKKKEIKEILKQAQSAQTILWRQNDPLIEQ